MLRTPSSGKQDWRICYALCLYEYKSTDPDHLSFLENEILEIVKQEDSGWWAALRDNKIGWVPSAFLQPISDSHAAALRNVREDLRSTYTNVPRKSPGSTHVSHRSHFFISDSPLSQEPYTQEDEWVPVIEHEDVDPQQARSIQIVSPTSLVSSKEVPDQVASIVSGLTTLSLPSHESPEVETSESESSPEIPDTLWSSKACPPSPMTPMPHPQKSPRSPELSRSLNETDNPLHTPVSSENSPSPITLSGQSSSSSLSRSPSDSRLYGRSGLPLHPNLFGNRSLRRRPIPFHGHFSHSNSSQSSSSLSSSSRSVSIDSPALGANTDAQESGFSPDLLNPFELREGRSPILRRRPDKIRQLTGDDDAAAFHQAKKNQAGLPWYLRPKYSGDDIKLEYDGSVRAGTLHALIERLTVDPLKQSQEFRFRHAFLTTFRTFTTADVVFDLLVERYSTDHPHGLSVEEFEEWKEKWLRPQQKRVLTVMAMWFEEHNLLRDYPHIIPRMRDFLSLVVASDSLATIAKDMLAPLDRLPPGRHSPSSSLTTPSRRRRLKLHKQDLIHADPSDIAEHLALYEHKLYAKLRSQECLDWGKGCRGEAVPNLCAFFGTHDKLAMWVKTSVLIHDSLGKRAEMLDTWIKIAERCRSLNNYSSMTAIVAALSSAVLTRLRLTWAHVARGSHLEPLQRLTEPTGNFSAFRTIYQTLDAPCVPFIGMFLTDIVHIHDQLPDTMPRQSSRSASDVSVVAQDKPDDGPPLINFIKCRKWYFAVRDMLRYQSKPYNFVEDAMTINYIEQQLSQMVDKEQTYLWTRSSELQQKEAAHSNIRRGLEDAGF